MEPSHISDVLAELALVRPDLFGPEAAREEAGGEEEPKRLPAAGAVWAGAPCPGIGQRTLFPVHPVH